MSHRLTHHVVEKGEITDSEEISICSMIHNLGQIIVLYYHPEAYFRIKTLARYKQSNKRRAARKVLGVTYDAIGIHYAEKWRLPFTHVESLRVCYFNRIGKTRENFVVNLPFCATELCAFAGGVLDGKQTLRLRELINSLNMFSRDLGNILDKAWSDTNQFAKQQKVKIKKRSLSEIAATG
ncbi:MAG TPA: HDOD domain-containing protein [Desulfobacteraceae bacterium]|nr:HDOD domain-containing protein [Desulfobacteraceae bacterium]